MADKLTDKQQAYIQYLVFEGLPVMEAAKKAGYHPGAVSNLNQAIREQIVEATEMWLAQHAPDAARKMVNMMGDEAIEPGSEKRLEAAKQILDRIGLTKRERVQTVSGAQLGIVFLPPKQNEEH